MGQSFEYQNLLTGTRSGAGWIRTEDTGGYNPDTGIALYNTKSSECFLWSPLVVLHTGREYSLSFYAASTDNMASTDVYVLDASGGSEDYEWVAAAKNGFKPPAGGRGPHGPSTFPRARGTARNSMCASTTTAARTAATRWSGSATSCSASRTCRTRGHRLLGRCGLSER